MEGWSGQQHVGRVRFHVGAGTGLSVVSVCVWGGQPANQNRRRHFTFSAHGESPQDVIVDTIAEDCANKPTF